MPRAKCEDYGVFFLFLAPESIPRRCPSPTIENGNLLMVSSSLLLCTPRVLTSVDSDNFCGTFGPQECGGTTKLKIDAISDKNNNDQMRCALRSVCGRDVTAIVTERGGG